MASTWFSPVHTNLTDVEASRERTQCGRQISPGHVAPSAIADVHSVTAVTALHVPSSPCPNTPCALQPNVYTHPKSTQKPNTRKIIREREKRWLVSFACSILPVTTTVKSSPNA